MRREEAIFLNLGNKVGAGSAVSGFPGKKIGVS